VSVRLKLEESRAGLLATISQRDASGKVTEPPVVFLVADKGEAKNKVKEIARGLGLKTYGFVDKTNSRTTGPETNVSG
jgi:hypothetical protein